MTAREKIEHLTNSWYGFNIFAGAMSLIMGGLGIFSLVWATLATFASLVVTYLLGRKLHNRSSLTRSVLIVLSVIFGLLGVVGLIFGVLRFELSLTYLLEGIYVLALVSMYFKSVRVLTDKQVKAYFA